MESDTAIQNSVMRLAKQQGQSPAQLEQYLIRLHQLGLKPEEQTYNILLRAYAEHDDLKAAAEILGRMGTDGTHLGLVVLTLFNLLKKKRKDVIELRRQFNEKPSINTGLPRCSICYVHYRKAQPASPLASATE